MLKYPSKSLFYQTKQYSNNPSNEFKLIVNCIHITWFCTDSCLVWCECTKMCHLSNVFISKIIIVCARDWGKSNFRSNKTILGAIVSALNEIPINPKHPNQCRYITMISICKRPAAHFTMRDRKIVTMKHLSSTKRDQWHFISMKLTFLVISLGKYWFSKFSAFNFHVWS